MIERKPVTQKAYLYYIRNNKLTEVEGTIDVPASYMKKTWFKWYVQDAGAFKLKELQVSAQENDVYNENVWYREPNKEQAAVALAAYYMARKNDALSKIEQYDDKLDICLND